MSDQILKDKHGQVLGKIVERGMYLELQNKHGHTLGKFDPKTNKTFNKHGGLLGQGNLLATLLE